MEKVDTLRYGENPHQPAARDRRTDREPRAAEGPFASGEPPLQGKALSYNNVLDAAAAAALARPHARPRDRHLQAHQPVRRRGASDPARGVGGGAGRRPGFGVRGVVAVTGDRRPAAGRAARLDLPRGGGRAGVRPGALEVLGTKPNLRLVVDASLDAEADRDGLSATARPPARGLPGLVPHGGGGVLVTAPDNLPDDSGRVNVHDLRPAHRAELRDIDLAWRLCRGVVVERDRARPRRHADWPRSAGRSRVDACRGAVDKARHVPGRGRARSGPSRRPSIVPFADGPQRAARRRRDCHRPARRLDA